MAGRTSISPDLSFFYEVERQTVLDVLFRERLEGSSPVIARISASDPEGYALKFEASIEDDGTCVHLGTPYDSVSDESTIRFFCRIRFA